MRALTPIRILLWSALLVPAVQARPRTDTVRLANGNELTCEIRSLARGLLTAKTDSLSTVDIRWEDVARVRSEFTFEIILSGGATYFSALETDAAGHLVVSGAPAISLRAVVSLTPIESRIANRFNGSIDAGYSFLKSNTTTELNLDGDIAYATRKRSWQLQVSDNLVIRKNTSSTRRTQADLSWNEILPNRCFLIVIAQFTGNNEMNLLQRYLLGAGAGRYLVRTNRTIVSAYAGGAYSTERYSGETRRKNSEGLVGVNSQIFRLHSPKIDITEEFRLWPNFTTSGRYRIDANLKAKFEVYKDLFLSVSYFDSYDSRNPTISGPLNDYGVVTAIGYTFNR